MASVKKQDELFDLTAELEHQTEKAYLLNDGTKKIWVPKSQVENNEDGTFTLPMWLAVERGLV
jgi:hypothetical protein